MGTRHDLLGKLLIPVLFAATAASGEQASAPASQWVRVQHTNQVSGVTSAVYALTGETIDIDRHPTIVLTCDGDRQPAVVYHTGIHLSAQAHNVFDHYADSIWAYVKVDGAKPYRGLWKIVPGPEDMRDQAVIDKKTLQYLFAGEKMRVSFRDYQDEEHIDDFMLPGLSVNDLQPFCAAKWLAKMDLNSDASRSSKLSRNR